jgi:hypothetical protein
MLIDEEDVEFGTSHDLLHTFVVVDPTLEAKAKVTKHFAKQKSVAIRPKKKDKQKHTRPPHDTSQQRPSGLETIDSSCTNHRKQRFIFSSTRSR